MERLKTSSILISLIEKMNLKGSWCGETHIQKAVYFLQEVTSLNLNFNYILYKHGPFSFDLRDFLSGMLTEGFLKLQPMFQYGPSYVIGDVGKKHKTKFEVLSQSASTEIESISNKLGNMNAAELEKLSTSLYFIKNHSDLKKSDMAKNIHSIKSHISVMSAEKAIEETDEIISAVSSH